jgi:glycosyltransferase involved in cell wall biosynthesis
MPIPDSPWVVIAAYDEAKVIEPVVRDVRRAVRHVVVVDDCSRDETGPRAAHAGAHVLRHPINLGQGAALQTGIDYALAQGAQTIVTFDADGQHDIADLPALLQAQRASGADCVLGSRFLGRTENLSAERRLLLKAAAWLTVLTAGVRLTDAHNGYRLFTRRAALTLRIRHNRMAHASEIIEQIARHGLRWVEAPVTVRYTDYSVAKGQRSSAALRILVDLMVGKLRR